MVQTEVAGWYPEINLGDTHPREAAKLLDGLLPYAGRAGLTDERWPRTQTLLRLLVAQLDEAAGEADRDHPDEAEAGLRIEEPDGVIPAGPSSLHELAATWRESDITGTMPGVRRQVLDWCAADLEAYAARLDAQVGYAVAGMALMGQIQVGDDPIDSDRPDFAVPAVDQEAGVVHCVMYRSGVLGTLCDSLAWGPPTRADADASKVTCPACLQRLEGARAGTSVRDQGHSFADPGPGVVVLELAGRRTTIDPVNGIRLEEEGGYTRHLPAEGGMHMDRTGKPCRNHPLVEPLGRFLEDDTQAVDVVAWLRDQHTSIDELLADRTGEA